jgi:hypothetical protein
MLGVVHYTRSHCGDNNSIGKNIQGGIPADEKSAKNNPQRAGVAGDRLHFFHPGKQNTSV